MSHRLSCLSTDFGLHIIRTIAGFFSSVFVCRYNEPSLKDSNASSRSSSSSSISSSLRCSTSSCELTNTNPSGLTAPSIILTTPSGRRRRHKGKQSQRGKRRCHKSTRSQLKNKLKLSTALSDCCSTHSEDSDSDPDYDQQSTYSNEEEEDSQLEQEITIRHQEMEKKLKVTEKELSHLNHKIEKLLVKLEEEYDTEMASSPDEECVICISAKATMQTFPCGHRVVCRKCFVKTIQMVVSQRMLPLRCVICRAKVLRLKQTTTGGLSTGYVRSNSKNQHHPAKQHLQNSHLNPVSRPGSLVFSSTSCYGCCSRMAPTTPTTPTAATPDSPLTEVFQAQKALYELHFRASNLDSSNCKDFPFDVESSDWVDRANGNHGYDLCEQFSRLVGCESIEPVVDPLHELPNRRHQLASNCANNNGHHSGSEWCYSCSRPSSNASSTLHPSSIHSSVCSSNIPTCVDSVTTQQGFLDWVRDANNNPTRCPSTWPDYTHANVPPNVYLTPWYFNRKSKYPRYLQHRRWSGSNQPFPLLNAQQHFFHFPVGHQSQPQQQEVQVENLGPWQRPHSFLVPINEDDEDRLLQAKFEPPAIGMELEPGPSTSSHSYEHLPYQSIASQSHLSPQSSLPQLDTIALNNQTNTNNTNVDKQTKLHRKHKTKIRKSRSESFLAVANRYKRLTEQEDIMENDSDRSTSSDQSDSETDYECEIKPNITNLANNSQVTSSCQGVSHVHCSHSPLTKTKTKLSARLRRKTVKNSVSLSSLISNTIQESFKMIRSLKLH